MRIGGGQNKYLEQEPSKIAESNLDSATHTADSANSTQKANSSIADEFLGFCEASEDDRTNGSSRKRDEAIPKKSLRDEFAPPLFTIAIPTYNRLETLKEALDSALNQDIDFRACESQSDIPTKIGKKSYEIIVVENVDDFSAESSAQKMIEREYFGKVTYYKNEANLGLFGNWNRCIELAKGKWVCLLHSDDLLMPNYLREMKNAIEKLDDNRVGMVSVESLYFGAQCDERTYYLPPYQRFCHISREFYTNSKGCIFPYFHPGGLLHNKRVILELGGYNADEYPAGDTLFIRRVCEKYAVLVYQKFLHLSRQEINEGLKSDIEDKYAYQYFHFYKSCVNVNDILKRFYLSQLRQNFTGNFWRNRSVKDSTIKMLYKNINLHFSAYEKIIIFLLRAKNKIKMLGNKFNINQYLR